MTAFFVSIVLCVLPVRADDEVAVQFAPTSDAVERQIDCEFNWRVLDNWHALRGEKVDLPSQTGYRGVGTARSVVIDRYSGRDGRKFASRSLHEARISGSILGADGALVKSLDLVGVLAGKKLRVVREVGVGAARYAGWDEALPDSAELVLKRLSGDPYFERLYPAQSGREWSVDGQVMTELLLPGGDLCGSGKNSMMRAAGFAELYRHVAGGLGSPGAATCSALSNGLVVVVLKFSGELTVDAAEEFRDTLPNVVGDRAWESAKANESISYEVESTLSWMSELGEFADISTQATLRRVFETGVKVEDSEGELQLTESGLVIESRLEVSVVTKVADMASER